MACREKDYKQKKEKKVLWKNIVRSFYMLIKFNKLYLPVSVVYKVIQGFLPTVYIVVMQIIINMIQGKTGILFELKLYILIFIVLHMLSSVLSLLYSKYNNDFCLGFSKMLGLRMMEKAMHLSMHDFEDSDTYNIINRAQNQSANDVIAYIDVIFSIFQEAVSGISMVYILWRFKWQYVVAILIVPIIKCAVTFVLDKKAYEMRVNRTSLERQKWYLSFLIMTGNAYREIKILGIGTYFLNKYKKIQDEIIKQEKSIYNKQTVANAFLEIIEGVITGIITFNIFIFVFVGKILIGDATAYIECTENIKGSVNNIFEGINNLIEQSMYIDLLFKYFELETFEYQGINQIDAIASIEVRNVSFKYNKDAVAIKDISLQLLRGQTVAIIGENGSGKTTLIKVLLGLYHDYEGEVFINGIDMHDIKIDTYQEKISIVCQDYIKYEASLRENIAYGDINKINSDDEICELLQAVKLEMKAKEKDGIDTVVGNWFGFTQCSIGEWQRLAIARALFKNADVYIFDEPDASLDVFKQKEIIELIKKAVKGKIGIYISHRINFVNEIAEKIIVLKEGSVCESGSHKELIKKKRLLLPTLFRSD